MDDFSADPTKPNAFGLPPHATNFVAAGKRPLSSMSPTVLVDTTTLQPRVVVGASGGTTIPTSTVQVLLDILGRHVNAKEALNVARLHHQLLPDVLWLEPTFSSAIADVLRSRGHNVRAPVPGQTLADGQTSGVVQVVVRHDNATLDAASDPRKGGRAVTF
mmetsp:Transcript_30653/g.74840  ORF Transcript_30653/g.74840 Transcript_30653/m.74840 type:complete len:161 (-) Transcript_30653:57-539(-)